jgi:uncharacterized membrane protein (UPF0127 family)
MKIKYFLVSVFILLLSFIFIKYISFNKNFLNTFVTNSQKSVIISGKKLLVDIADTPALQTKGLSGRQSLDENQGMLFVFPSEAKQFFWMKDMLFPIDIIWINKDEEIVYIDENAPIPEPNTADYKLPLYSSPKAVKYVLEVNAGYSEKYSIKVGDRVEITF